MSRSVRISLIESTSALRSSAAAATSRATVTCTLVPGGVVAPMVTSMPGSTPVKVLVDEWTVSGPIVMAASARAVTLAPPRRAEPSRLVSVKSDVAPVVADWTLSR